MSVNSINIWTGTEGPDLYNGSDSSEFLDGYRGDDTLFGGRGNDTIVGGGGNDTSIFLGAYEEYIFSRTENGDGLVVIGPDGRDELYEVEFIEFDWLTIPVIQYDFYPNSAVSQVNLVGGGQVRLVSDFTSYGSWSQNFVHAEIFDENGDQVGESIDLGNFGTSGRDGVRLSLSAELDGGFNFIIRRTFESSVSRYIQERYDGNGNFIGTYPGGIPAELSYALKISGAPEENEQLNVELSSLPANYEVTAGSYQWRRNGAEVTNANFSSYEISQDDVGAQISVSVDIKEKGSADDAPSQTITSNFTNVIENVNNPVSGNLVIDDLNRPSHQVVSGDLLSANSEDVFDADGLGDFVYQWFRDGYVVDGENSQNYFTSSSDVGSNISVRITYVDAFGNTEEISSAPTEDVLENPSFSIFGSSEGETLLGTEKSEFINGLSGDDLILGLGGVDRILGGESDDFLIGDSLNLSHITEIAQQIYRLYLAVFGRQPEPVGHFSWADQLFSENLTLIEIADLFIVSQEFEVVYGSLNDYEFVTLLYRNVLGREPDATGFQAWLERLNSGDSRAETILGFSESQEFVTATLGSGAELIHLANPMLWSDEIYRVYVSSLGREPDQGGFLNWIGALANGLSLEEVANYFMESKEFQNVYGSLDNASFVDLLYRNVLNREPDQTGRDVWVTQLEIKSRVDVLLGFSQSPEFIRKTDDDLISWMRQFNQDDSLEGGLGEDILFGGALSDVFQFTTESETEFVADFEPWDFLSFVGFGYSSPNDAIRNMIQDDSSTSSRVVFSDQGVTVTLQDYQLSQISEDMILVSLS